MYLLVLFKRDKNLMHLRLFLDVKILIYLFKVVSLDFDRISGEKMGSPELLPTKWGPCWKSLNVTFLEVLLLCPLLYVPGDWYLQNKRFVVLILKVWQGSISLNGRTLKQWSDIICYLYCHALHYTPTVTPYRSPLQTDRDLQALSQQ